MNTFSEGPFAVRSSCRTWSTKKLTLEVEAEAPGGFAEGDVSVVRDNVRQLKFKADSTGFDN
jgi:hypothetical protein